MYYSQPLNFAILFLQICQYSAPSVVRLGTRNLAVSDPDSASKDVDIKDFINHPYYNKVSGHDIALIELEEVVKFDNVHLRPACLQQSEYRGLNVTAVRDSLWKR